ncbi:MAG: ABC transporter permease [Pseudomonadota bacterium]|nr:ABC transporter permease [Pseudomonadota bacterium]
MLLSGDFRLRHLAGRSMRGLRRQLRRYGTADVQWDLRQVGRLDSAGATLLWQAWAERRPRALVLRPEQEALFERLEQLPAPTAPRRAAQLARPIIGVGERIFGIGADLRDWAWLVGRLLLDVLYLLVHPRQIPLKEISAHLTKVGARALPITGLVGLLIGVVLSYLSSRQLQQFGGEAFLVYLMGFGVTRELGPLLAAILVAGRSGSSMTAELGVMRVTEELDALVALGISPTIRLVLPKVIGLAIALPLLVVWTDAMAILGGMLIAKAELNMTFAQYLSDLPDAIPLGTFWMGMYKAATFGMLIAMVASHYGLRIEPNTESLGRETTNSVVAAITIVILADAVFAILLRDVGWYD